MTFRHNEGRVYHYTERQGRLGHITGAMAWVYRIQESRYRFQAVIMDNSDWKQIQTISLLQLQQGDQAVNEC
jgi:hypothetical protein